MIEMTEKKNGMPKKLRLHRETLRRLERPASSLAIPPTSLVASCRPHELCTSVNIGE